MLTTQSALTRCTPNSEVVGVLPAHCGSGVHPSFNKAACSCVLRAATPLSVGTVPLAMK